MSIAQTPGDRYLNSGAGPWGGLTGDLEDQTDLAAALAAKAAAAHNHTGVYQPADSTILKDADIGVTVAAALGANDNYVTDAEKTVIGNTSGTNSGDNATNTQYSGLAASKQDAAPQLTELAGLVYAGNTLKVIRVNAGETGFELATPAAGGSPKRIVGITFDGDGSPPTVGSTGYIVVPFTGTIDQWAIVADAAGSAVVDVWKAAGSIPTNGNTIAGSEKPTLSAQQLNSDTSLSTWTTAVTAGDVFGFELESVATCTRITCEVRIAETL